MQKSPVPNEKAELVDAESREVPVKYALLPPHFDCVVDCVAFPDAVIVFGDPDESVNDKPVPSMCRRRETLLKYGSVPAVMELLAVE
jgi:hypothetical protein